ncbi:hypothetical protein LOTGIDRAFT_231168 [Lottia gigantea]|uniref:Alpha-galactosidase n=1 Tax=Lottia gigantea TaxID=225164 RepID=V4AYM1_LOTGI|nr:hypothetical protein LOTGIDRAFT_231168 [Lottia gigantea]ESO98786.1 hypothetical protein LOTGIDRAFT_231168 [Lottia gigantea]
MGRKIIYIVIFLLHNFILGTKGNVRLAVEVGIDDGSYRIKVDKDVWLVGASPFFYIDGIRYTMDEGNLEFQNVTQSFGSGPGLLGNYSAYDIHYKANETNIIATVKSYASPNLLFQVQYVDGGNNTTGYNEWETICGFPGFEMDSDLLSLGYLTFSNRNIDTVVSGRWNKTAFIPDSLEGSGPVALFDHTGRTIVISQADNFMAASTWRDKTNNRLYWGIMGGVDQIPVNFTYQTTLSFDISIRKGLCMWGFFLSSFIYYTTTAFTPRYRHADISRQYIGYWTSPGSAYYDSPGTGNTYEQIIHDVILESQQNGFKYRYVQLDNWWYVKSTDGKIKEWSPSPTELPHGLQALQNSSGVQFLAYAGMWAADNVYVNGSDSDFIVENNIALPISQAFWDKIFKTARSWGIKTYEQDKLSDTFLSMNSTKTDLHLANDWLSRMSSAAYRNNITILYNDACPRHILQTLVTPAVTQISVNDDSGQWSLGVKALFVSSLPIRLGKSVFRTKSGHGITVNPALKEVIAILSGGSVGVGDSVGSSDYDLLKRCCNNEGKILSPTQVAKAVDGQILQAAFQDGSGPIGEVWSVLTYIQTKDIQHNALRYGTIFAYQLQTEFIASPTSTQLNSYDKFPRSVVYSLDNPTSVYNFSDTDPFVIHKNDCTNNFCLFHTAPTIDVGDMECIILGDTSKWIPMSDVMVRYINTKQDAIVVSVRAAPKETIKLDVLINRVLQTYPVQMDENGEGAVMISGSTPSVTSPEPTSHTPSISLSISVIAISLTITSYFLLIE